MIKNYIRAIPCSFYDTKLYLAVVQAWKGMGYTYLFVLSLCISALMIGQILYSLHVQISDDHINSIIDSIPVITVQDGRAISDIEEPCDVPLSQARNLTLRIDMQSDPNTLKTVGIEQGFILYAEQFDIISEQKVLRTYPLDKLENGRYDREKLISAWSFIKNVMPFLIFIPVAMGMWFKYIVRALIVTVVSYIMTASMKDEYDFAVRMRMSAIAVTPPLIIDTIMLLTLSRPLSIFAVIGIATLFVYVMIRVNRSPNSHLDTTA